MQKCFPVENTSYKEQIENQNYHSSSLEFIQAQICNERYLWKGVRRPNFIRSHPIWWLQRIGQRWISKGSTKMSKKPLVQK